MPRTRGPAVENRARSFDPDFTLDAAKVGGYEEQRLPHAEGTQTYVDESDTPTAQGIVSASTVEATTFKPNAINLLYNGDGEAVNPDTELIANGTFETNVLNWTTGSNTTIAQTAAQAHGGTKSMAVTRVTSTGNASITSDLFRVTPFQNHTLTAYLRTAVTARTCWVFINYYDHRQTLLGTNTISTGADASGSWTAFGSAFAMNTNISTFATQIVWASLTIRFDAAIANEVHYVDDVSFKVVDVLGWSSDTSPSFVALSSDTGTFRSGLASIKWTSYASATYANALGITSGLIPAVQLAAYIFDFWIRPSAAAQLNVEIAWYEDGSLATFDTAKYQLSLAATTWRNVSFVTKIPEGISHFTVSVQSPTPSIDFNLDDATVTRGASYIGGHIEADYVSSKTDVVDATGVVWPVGGLCPWAGILSDGVGVAGVAAGGGGSVVALGGIGAGDSDTAIAGVPAGWVPCDGRAVSRSDFWRLFSVVGTTYGVGDGSTTFNVPDLRGRVPVGLDNLGGSDAGRLSVANTLGGSGGEEKHTMSIGELATHNHPWNDSPFFPTTVDAVVTAGAIGHYIRGGTNMIGNTGSSTPFNVMQPYILINWLIKC